MVRRAGACRVRDRDSDTHAGEAEVSSRTGWGACAEGICRSPDSRRRCRPSAEDSKVNAPPTKGLPKSRDTSNSTSMASRRAAIWERGTGGVCHALMRGTRSKMSKEGTGARGPWRRFHVRIAWLDFVVDPVVLGLAHEDEP